MTRSDRIGFLSAAMVALAQTTLGQRAANWRVYKATDGLPESACVSVSLAPQGKILVKHFSLSSISELDGYAITVLAAPEGSGRVYESPAGQLWTVEARGLQEFKEGSWVLHSAAEIGLPVPSARPSDPIPLYPVRQGLVLCLLPDRLLEFNSTLPVGAQTRVMRRADQTQLESFSTMTPARDGGLWIAGARGLARVPAPIRNLKPETEWQEFLPPTSLPIHHLQDPREDQSGGVSVVAESLTNHQKLAVYFEGRSWSARGVGGNKIRQAWRGPDGSWWAASISALFHAEAGQDELLETEEISARQYFDVALEPNGPFWLATSEGLFRFAPLSWRNAGWGRNAGSLIHCLTGDAQERIWFVSAGSLHLLDKERHEDYLLAGTPAQELTAPRSLIPLKNGSLLIEGEEQLIRFDPAARAFRAVALPKHVSRAKPIGLVKDGRVCLQTWLRESSKSAYSLELFDGTEFRSLACPAPDAVIGGELSAFFETQNGDLWIGAEHGTAHYDGKKWREFNAGDKASPDSPVAFLELADGKTWCATVDKIWQFDERDWSEVRSGFDRINGMIHSRRDGSFWVASNGGLHRFTQQGAWVENGIEEGLPGMSVRALFEDPRGRLWAGTSHGLSLYDPDADRDPPQPTIDPLPPEEKNLREGGAVTVTFAGQDKWKYTPRLRLLFSSKLGDKDWTPFQDVKQAVLTDLPAGKHIFQVRAMDRNCNMDLKPAKLEIAVILPWYKETRLLFISLAGVALALFFAGLAINRHRQLLRSYAEVEKQVAERTRELEVASRELFHSQKMNALGTLAAGIAHDFNNILSIIKGSAQIIEDNLENQDKVRTRVDRIKTVVEQGAGIVKAMLGFSRESDGPGAACDLNLVVEDTIKLLGDRFLREVQVSFQPAAHLPLAACPKDFVQQILINFIFNAAESTEMHKEILLATRQLDALPTELVLAPAPASRFIAVNVVDRGCGIPAENLPRIFEPFFTTKVLSTRRGTGLGLSMVYELAKKMGAGLAVQSVVGQGSVFALILAVSQTRKNDE